MLSSLGGSSRQKHVEGVGNRGENTSLEPSWVKSRSYKRLAEKWFTIRIRKCQKDCIFVWDFNLGLGGSSPVGKYSVTGIVLAFDLIPVLSQTSSRIFQ